MHETEFADAFRPKRFTVLLLPLVDYTIGHEVVLWQKRNPLVTSPASFCIFPAEEQSRALAEAALVCSQKQPRFVARWVRKFSRLDLNDEAEKFLQYRACGSQDLPTVQMPRTPGAAFHYFGAPELARLINYVTASHGVMIAAHFDGSPLNFPMGLARMLYVAESESGGFAWVRNQQDEEREADRRRFEEANPESTFAVGDDAVQKQAEEWNAKYPGVPVPLMRDKEMK